MTLPPFHVHVLRRNSVRGLITKLLIVTGRGGPAFRALERAIEIELAYRRGELARPEREGGVMISVAITCLVICPGFTALAAPPGRKVREVSASFLIGLAIVVIVGASGAA